jgi:hypothetical protein
MDRDETWYISGGSIKINNNVSSKSVSLSKQSDRVIQVTEGGHEYYLYASRIANASFTGKVVAFEDASQSVQRSVAGGKGWIKVVVDDLDNGSTTTAQTDGEGNFEVEDAIPGDEYRITPEGGTPVTVTPKGDGDDIGVITITDGVNFKTRGPQEALSPNKDHNITLEIANVGTEDCTAATYHLRFEDGLISSTAAEDALGTIEPGKTKKVAVTLRYIPSGEQYASKKIFITITDQISKKTWTDSVSLRFYDSTWDIPFSVSATSSVSGIIISPEYQTYWFSGTNEKVSVPWSPGEYLVVFSGASADTEATYSFSVYGAPTGNLTGFTDLGNHEPNDTEQTATRLSEASVVSYLHKNDIDYYRYTAPSSKDIWPLTGLDGSLAWLDKNALPDTMYVITLSRDEAIGPKTLSYGGKSVNITLSGGGAAERAVSLSSQGSLLTVGQGVTLTLDNNVTLRGLDNNTAPLIKVNSGGILEMKIGSKISGNSSSSSSYGGGVYVDGAGTFTMSGGEISGNSSSSSYSSYSLGGGVYVNGTFTMSGGEISGNSSSSSSYSLGGGVYVDGTFAMSGGKISGNSSSSSYSSYGGGVYVAGRFTKQSGGTIYGSDHDTLKNTAVDGGHAVYVSGGRKRDTTVGEGVSLDSRTEAGWDY